MSYRIIQTNERVERRHDHRFGRPLKMLVEGHLVVAADWGFGGFRAPAIPGLKWDEQFLISHMLHGEDNPIAVFATAKIVRIDRESGDIGAGFLHLGERAFALMEQAMFRRRRPVPILAG